MKKQFLSLLLLCSAAASSFSAFGMSPSAKPTTLKTVKKQKKLSAQEQAKVDKELIAAFDQLIQLIFSLESRDYYTKMDNFFLCTNKIISLLQSGANPNIEIRFMGISYPLECLLEMSRSLLLKNYHEYYNDGIKPLIKCLLECGANPNMAHSEEQFPSVQAARLLDVELIDLLLKHGADPNRPKSCPPLTQVYSNHKDKYVSYNYEEKRIAVIERFLKAGANIDHTDLGETILQKAVHYKEALVVRFLLEHGASTSRTLSYIMMDDNMADVEIAELLLKHGAVETSELQDLFCKRVPFNHQNTSLQKLLLRWRAQPFDDNTRALKDELEQELAKEPGAVDYTATHGYYKKLLTDLGQHFIPDLAYIVAEYTNPALEDIIVINRELAKKSVEEIQRKVALRNHSNSVTLHNDTQSTSDDVARNQLDEDDAKHDENGNIVEPAQSIPAMPTPPAWLVQYYANMPTTPQFVRDHYAQQQEPNNSAHRVWLQAQESAEPAQQGSSVEDLD